MAEEQDRIELDEARELLRDIAQVRDLLLDMGQAHRTDQLLELVVQGIADLEGVAAARIWLERPGDRCVRCPLRPGCPDQTRCLHAVASRGNSLVDPQDTFSDLQDAWARIPEDPKRWVARIFLEGQAITVPDLARPPAWFDDPGWRHLTGIEDVLEWIERERIRGFLAAPVGYREERFGVIAVYTRAVLHPHAGSWLQIAADHLGAALRAAKDFELVVEQGERWRARYEDLRDQVEEPIIGRSEAIRTVLRQVELVAPTDANVLVLGESGTGKELVAREVHRKSARRDGPLVRVNCASIPRELYESEFFGHVEGAFTGANKDRPGRFELAEGGTLLLDEVGEIPLDLQSKLLRVLQEGQYERVGESRTRDVDVRIVAATNRDLLKEISAGRFRQDLYYRLAVFPIEVAPLRERKEDVPVLAEHFLRGACRRWNQRAPRLTQANLAALLAYDWPGNVRELQNVVERALISSRGARLSFDLPGAAVAAARAAAPAPDEPATVLTEDELRRLERDNLLRALERTDWKVYGDDGAAALLGIKPTTLASRIKKLDLKPPR